MDAVLPNTLAPSLSNLAITAAAAVLIAWIIAILVQRSDVADCVGAVDAEEVVRLPGAGRHIQSLQYFSRYHIQHVLRRSHAEASCVIRPVVVPGDVGCALRGSTPPSLDCPSIFVDMRSKSRTTAVVHWGVSVEAVHALQSGGLAGLRAYQTEDDGDSRASDCERLFDDADCLQIEEVEVGSGTAPYNLVLPPALRAACQAPPQSASAAEPAPLETDALGSVEPTLVASAPWPRLTTAVAGRLLAVVVLKCDDAGRPPSLPLPLLPESVGRHSLSYFPVTHPPSTGGTRPDDVELFGAGLGMAGHPPVTAAAPLQPHDGDDAGGDPVLAARFVVLVVEWALTAPPLPPPPEAPPGNDDEEGEEEDDEIREDGSRRRSNDEEGDTTIHFPPFPPLGGAPPPPPPLPPFQPRLFPETLLVLPSRSYAVTEVYGTEVGADEECSVCLTEPQSVLLLPCRHFSVCMSCFRHLADKCPNCRSSFVDYIHAIDATAATPGVETVAAASSSASSKQVAIAVTGGRGAVGK